MEHIIVGPAQHGVVEYALALHAHTGGTMRRFAVGEPLTTDATEIQLCFTDHLFGADPDSAVDNVVALAHGRRLSVSFHDIPQPEEGAERYARRAQAYQRLAARADIAVVNSQHEAQFFDLPTAIIPLPLVPAAADAPVPTVDASVPTVDAPPAAGQPAADIGVMGFIYPGKGHRQLIEALAGTGATITALGDFSEGSHWLAPELERAALDAGLNFTVTGYLSTAELEARMMATAIPVCAHQHFSASGSLMKWISLGRRVLVSDSPYSRELARRWPDFITLVAPGQWADTIANLDPQFSQPLPVPTDWTWSDVAQAYHRAWSFPTVSVIVPYYDNQAGLDELSAAIAGQDYPGDIELIVADDGSPTPPRTTAQVVRQADLGFRAAAARNLGASAASGEVLVFLDGDTIPSKSYIRYAATACWWNPTMVVVGRRIHGDGQEPTWLRQAWEHTRNLATADDTSWRFIISAVLSCSRQFFTQLGGFDGTMVGYGGEDWDFGWRAWNAGALLRHEPRAVAVHPEPDWGQRKESTIAQKNAETIALSHRISHPLARPESVVFNRPDCVVISDADEAVLCGWLALPDVHILTTRRSELFAADPRVHIQPEASPEQLHQAAVALTGRFVITAHVAGYPDSLADIHQVEANGGAATIVDAQGQLLAKVSSARGRALHSPTVRSTASQPWRIPDRSVRLERLFARW